MSRQRTTVKNRIRRRAKRVGLDLADGLVERLWSYVELLRRWNQRMNLTALDDGDRGLDRLLIEPLIAATHLPAGRKRIVDIGSGAGSPAIPMKFALLEAPLLMVESKVRRAAFLREACRHLEVEGAEVETARFESLLTRAELHEAHDVLTLRAVRVESRVLNGLQAFVRPGGFVFLFRGGSGPDIPDDLRPPLAWLETHPLVDILGSRLVVLQKRGVGRSAANKKPM